MNEAHEAVLSACVRALGDDLHAAYGYGSTGDVYVQPAGPEHALLLVIADDVDLESLREIVGPVWPASGEEAGRPPLVATPRSLERHLRLFPLLANHLAHEAERLAGKRLLAAARVPEAHLAERAAYLAAQAMEASAALAPAALPPVRAEAAEERLRRLAAYLSGTEDGTTAECFARVQDSVQELLEALPGARPARAATAGSERVSAIYEETDRVVVVTPVLAAEALGEMAWAEVDGRLEKPGMALRVSTAEQLRLSLLLERPLDVALERYQHLHGRDVLEGITIPMRAIWRHAARTPSALLIEEVPGAYLTAGDDEARHRVVHDYQNRLLNMRLQHELLHRLHDFEPAEPPEPLPGRDAPVGTRVKAILGHLGWWADHYVQGMRETPAGNRLRAP